MSTIELTYLLIRNWLPELAEVPADQLVRGEPEPGVAAVGRERLASGVLAGEQKLGDGKRGNVHASLRLSVQSATARATAAQPHSTAKPAHGASG